MDPIPPESLLQAYPDEIRAGAETLRAVVRRAVPDAVERVRRGWRLIGYEVPDDRSGSIPFSVLTQATDGQGRRSAAKRSDQ